MNIKQVTVKIKYMILLKTKRWMNCCESIYLTVYRLNKSNKVFTHMTVEEKITLHETARTIKTRDANIVEIGSYLGASSCFMAAGLKSGKICCIDTWQNNAMTEGNRDTYAEFRKNTEQYGDKIVKIRGWSYDVVEEIEKLTNKKIDVLFIDGDHSYEGVKKDWNFYSPMLHKGSVVIFHDSGWAEGVRKVIGEDASKVAEIKTQLPNMTVMTIK